MPKPGPVSTNINKIEPESITASPTKIPYIVFIKFAFLVLAFMTMQNCMNARRRNANIMENMKGIFDGDAAIDSDSILLIFVDTGLGFGKQEIAGDLGGEWKSTSKF